MKKQNPQPSEIQLALEQLTSFCALSSDNFSDVFNANRRLNSTFINGNNRTSLTSERLRINNR